MSVSRVTGPLFKFFGSKWTAARRYPAPEYGTVVEPFAGSAGYSLRHAERNVVLYERNRDVRALWRWLIEEATEGEIRALPVGLPVGTDLRTVGASAGATLLMRFWQRTNCLSQTWTVSPWGNMPGLWTANTRARVASEVGAVKHWLVGADGLAALRGAREPATWFCDPPYLYGYRYGSGALDHEALGALLRGAPGQVIACEAPCAKTGRVPAYLPFSVLGTFVTSRRKATNHHHSTELVWTR